MVFRDVSEFYDGSTLLEPYFKNSGLTIDKVNFLACQFTAILLGFPYRNLLGPHKVSPTCRHVTEIVTGFLLAYFCFGRQIVHLLAQSGMCLLLMRTVYPGMIGRAVLAFAMIYLWTCHIYRQIYDYGGYTLDITGPLMVNTQRLTSLAFGLRDGQEKDENKLSEMQKQQSTRRQPSLLEFFSYIFCFHGFMCGPFCFYNDYIDFIEGRNYKTVQTSTDNDNDNHTRRMPGPPPAPGMNLVKRLAAAAFFGASTIYLLPFYPFSLLTGPDFKDHSFFSKNVLITVVGTLVRHKYYFAWKLGEAANINSGLGFNGYSETGEAKWDLIDNVDIPIVEFATSPKIVIDHWNMSTMKWLKYIVYERWHNFMIVFVFSAFWHGFYIGYYVCCATFGLIYYVSRLLHRHARPYFVSSRLGAIFYNTATFLASRLTMPYAGFPFVVMELMPSWNIYRYVYCWQHIVALVLLVALTIKPYIAAN